MEISQLTPVIDMNGDSISNYIFEIRKLLTKEGFQSNVYVEERAAFFPNFIKDYKDFNPKEDDITILHATIATKLTDCFIIGTLFQSKRIAITNPYIIKNLFSSFQKSLNISPCRSL